MNQQNPFTAAELVTDVELVEPTLDSSMDPSARQPEVRSTIKTSIFERMLSPQSLQIMMLSGGGILAIGFAIWLWSIGLFENPVIAAVGMGAINLGLLAAGVILATRTRFKLAGRGLAFLSSLLLPLHLWFYDAQGLIEVAEGGHLWIPALVICGLFAWVARLTRDSIFVYNFVGGIVLAGLLFLANPQLTFLWSVIPTCAFLVIVGSVSIHTDRFFVEESGAFSRQEFGRAFFRAGHTVLAGGLGYLLFSQTFIALFDSLVQLESFSIGDNPHVNFWSLPILAAACWAYVFSHRSRPWENTFPLAAAAIVIWMGLTALNVFSFELTVNLILVFVAVMLVAIQLSLRMLNRSQTNETQSNEPSDESAFVSVANFILLGLGSSQAMAALVAPETFFNTTFVIQVFVTTVSLLVGAEKSLGEKSVVLSNFRVAGSGLLMTFATLLAVLHWTTWSPTMAIGAVLSGSMLLALISQFVSSPQFQRSLLWATASATGGILSATGLLMITNEMIFGSIPSLAVVLTCGSLFVLIAITTRNRAVGVGAFMAFATALAQIAVLLKVTSAMPIIIAISLIGVAIQLGSVLARRRPVAAKEEASGATFVAGESLGEKLGSTLIVSGSVAAMLYVLPLLCLNQVTGWQAALMLFQLFPLGVGYLLNSAPAWRHSFQTLAVATSVCAAITFAATGTIPVVYRVEIVALVAGAALLILGHVGWATEAFEPSCGIAGTEAVTVKRNETVSLSLAMGGLLLAVPMMVGMIAFRLVGVETADFWRSFHEIGALAIGLTLLGSGILCRIRSTTLSGATVLVGYVATLLVLIRLPAELQSISVLMMIGGGAFFGIAILLSVYRDWLLGLPSKIREGEGMFKVLKWR